MGALATAPGVLGEVIPTYVTVYDVMELLGCKNNKAYITIRAINKIAVDTGKMAYGQGKASKYIFAEKFGIPMSIIDTVIEMNKGKDKSRRA